MTSIKIYTHMILLRQYSVTGTALSIFLIPVSDNREEDDASQCAVPISTALIKQIVTKTQGTGTQAQILSDFYTADSSSHLPWPYIKKDSYR